MGISDENNCPLGGATFIPNRPPEPVSHLTPRVEASLLPADFQVRCIPATCTRKSAPAINGMHIIAVLARFQIALLFKGKHTIIYLLHKLSYFLYPAGITSIVWENHSDF